MSKIDRQELYCSLFIDYIGEINALVLELKNMVGGEIKLDNYLKNLILDICVCSNDSHNDPKYGKPIPWGTTDEFLYYKYFLEIFPKDENPNQEEYEKELGNLLEKLWAKGYKAVAAYGFEENLPRNGGMGYDSTGKTVFKD